MARGRWGWSPHIKGSRQLVKDSGHEIAEQAFGGKTPALAKVTYEDTLQDGAETLTTQPRTDEELNVRIDVATGKWTDGRCLTCRMPIGTRHVATVDPPGDAQLWSEMAGESEGITEATDGCEVEPDGTCIHGHRSWWLELGLC